MADAATTLHEADNPTFLDRILDTGLRVAESRLSEDPSAVASTTTGAGGTVNHPAEQTVNDAPTTNNKTLWLIGGAVVLLVVGLIGVAMWGGKKGG